MDKTKLSVTLFLISESIFFILLILAYILFHGQTTADLDTSNYLDVKRTGFFTLLLISSSITMAISLHGAKKGNYGTMLFWLLLTIGLGFAFLYGQATEWLGLVKQDITISRDLFGATFFTLTGFHGFHVFIGLIILTILLGLTWLKSEWKPKLNAVDSISLYWHFVDGVWIVVFTVIYLL